MRAMSIGAPFTPSTDRRLLTTFNRHNMRHDGKIAIAVAMSARSKVWKNKTILWSDLVAKLAEVNRTNETAKEYAAANKEERLKIKDVGGYVGGYLRGGKRSPKNVGYRQLITLDIDFASMDFWDDFTMLFSNAAVVHATHSHTAESPRLRLVMPINREVTADEYVAISRQVAGLLGIEFFDNTTFETNRLMFWQSVSKDVDYYYEVQDGEWIDADEILAMYADWRDTSLWATAKTYTDQVRGKADKQEQPRDKKGVIGAFCRTYGIADAIETFLPDVYLPCDQEDRYTYTGGSAAAGLIVYDDTFAFSHHGTDPCSGKLSNAFDLVRIHKFGHLDSDALTGSQRPKSQVAMEEFARKDEAVKMTIAKESLADAKYEFAEGFTSVDTEDTSIEWAKKLEVDARGNYLSTAANLSLIFRNDSRLKGTLKLNEFDNKRYVVSDLLPVPLVSYSLYTPRHLSSL